MSTEPKRPIRIREDWAMLREKKHSSFNMARVRKASATSRKRSTFRKTTTALSRDLFKLDFSSVSTVEVDPLSLFENMMTPKEEMWSVKSLPNALPPTDSVYTKDSLKHEEFVSKMTQRWEDNMLSIRTNFENIITKMAHKRNLDIYLNSACLKEELQNTKNALDKTTVLDENYICRLKNTWYDTVDEWKSDLFKIDKRDRSLLEKTVGSYLSKLIKTRHPLHHIYEVMMALVLELNQILIGNIQTVVNTEYHLKLLWNTHYRDWYITYCLRAGLFLPEIKEEKKVVEEEEEEYGGEDCDILQTLLDIVTELKKSISNELPRFVKTSKLLIPLLLYLENCAENIRTTELTVVDLLYSEVRTCLQAQKTYSTIKLRGSLVDEVDGIERQTSYIDATEMARDYISQAENLIWKTVTAWNDTAERLEASKLLVLLIFLKEKESHKTLMTDWEINMNYAIDSLRQAHSLVHLENMWNNQTEKLLEECERLLNQTFTTELSILDLYPPMSLITFQLLVSSFNEIIFDSSNAMSPEELPRESTEISLEDELYKGQNLILSEEIIKSINNWRTGYLEAVTLFRNEIEESYDQIDVEWKSGMEAELRWQLDMKYESLDHRKERIKNDIVDVRAAELKLHDDIVSSHCSAIRATMKQLASIDLSKRMAPMFKEIQKVADEVRDLNIEVHPRDFAKVIDILAKAKRKYESVCRRCDHDLQRIVDHVDRYFEWMQAVNLQLLRSIRMFNEGGNFSADEASSVLYLLQRTHKDMANEKKALLAKLTKGIPIGDMEIGFEIQRFLTHVELLQKELLIRYNMRFALYRTKRALKRAIYNGRLLLNSAQDSLENAEEDNFDSMEKVLALLLKCSSYLFHGDIAAAILSEIEAANPLFSTSFKESLQTKASGGMYVPKEKSNRKPKFIKEVKKALTKCRESLHTYVREDAGQAVSKLSRTQSGPTNVLFKARVNAGNVLLHNLLPKMTEYHKQSILVWLDMIREFLRIMCLYRNKLIDIVDRQSKQFSDIWFTKMKQIEKRFSESLKQFSCDSIEYRKKMKERLKTMFGHPKHRHILKDMTQKAMEFCEIDSQNLKKIILYHKNNIRQFFKLYLSENDKFQSELNMNIHNMYYNKKLETAVYKLATQLMDPTKSTVIIKYLLRRGRPSLPPQRPITRQFSLAENAKLDETTLWNLHESVFTLILAITHFLIKLTCIPETNEKGKVEENKDGFELKTPMKYHLSMKKLRSELIKTAKKILEIANLSMVVYVSELQDWMMAWKTDCQRITDVFDHIQ